MGLRKIFYISVSTGAQRDSDGSLDDICAVSRRRNEEQDVSGALLYSGQYFAQVLEGEETAVRVIMSSILRDERHLSVAVLTDQAISERRFKGWTLAFARRSAFLNAQLAGAFNDPPRRAHKVRNLERFMSGMVDD